MQKKDISERCINIPPSTEAEVDAEGDEGVERAGIAGMSERKSVDRKKTDCKCVRKCSWKCLPELSIRASHCCSYTLTS